MAGNLLCATPMPDPKKPPPEKSVNVSEHLANERTYLAWLRTSVSIVSLGFATNRFSYFLRHSPGLAPRENAYLGLGHTEQVGLGMLIAGTLMMVISAIHYTRVSILIDRGRYQPQYALVWLTSGIVVLIGVTCISLLV